MNPGETVTIVSNEELESILGEAFKQMNNSMRELGKLVTEVVVPENRNFSIEIRKTDKSLEGELFDYETIILKKSNGQEIDLSSYLSKDHKFMALDKFCYDRENKLIQFDDDQINYRGFLLALFHEIGHSYQKSTNSIFLLDCFIAAVQGLAKIVLSIRVKKYEDANSKKIKYTLDCMPDERAIPLWFINKDANAKAYCERDAWVFSLKALRQLEKKGYDVFAGFVKSRDIKLYTGYNLYTYEWVAKLANLTSGGISAFNNYKPKFLKGSVAKSFLGE